MSSRPELKFSDQSDERSFYRKFQRLPTRTPNLLRIVDKGDYFTALGEDAAFVAENVYRTTSVLKQSQGVDYVTMSTSVVSQLLGQCLFEKGMKVEVYDKTWELTKFASPGNVEQVEDLIQGGANDTTGGALVVVALKVANKPEGKTVGFSFIDTNAREICVAEFIDNEVYSNLESLLIQIDAKEVLVQGAASEDPDYTKLLGVVDRCGAVTTELKSSDFSNKDIEQDLTRLLGDDLALSVGDIATSTAGLSATSAVLSYLGLLTDDSNFGTFKLKQHALNQFMKLDSSAVKALNLFPTAQNSSGAKNTSIFGLLNHCKSAGGVRLLHQWIKQPLVDVEDIRARHELLQILLDDTQMRTILQEDLLPSVPDVRRLNKKLAKANSHSLEDVVRVYQFLLKVPEILDVLEGKQTELGDDEDELKLLVEATWTTPIRESFTPLTKLQELVETTVDLDALDRHEFVIKPEYDEILQSYRSRLDDIEDEIRSIHHQVADSLNLDAEKKLKLELHANHGWCMRLTRTEERAIRGKKQFIELQTVKAGVFFTTEQMREIAQESAEIQAKYSRQQSSLVKEIVSIAGTYAPVLEKLSIALAHLDVMVSFAHASAYAPVTYVKPTMYPLGSDEGKTILKEARHPCVEAQDGVAFIANDVELIKGESEFLVITGPNMGGKSTFIRQLGCIALMAQIGCFVPATEANLPVFDAVLARVGAGDSQLKGVSTFMVEMLETASILKTASSDSLIIIDELGRGTSTYDGFGLAWAIAEHIASKLHCFTLFATHFHELTKLAEQVNTVKNLHVVAHVEGKSDDITLLYTVEPGVSDQSFGIHVAEVVGFPQKIVNMAKRKAAELDNYEEESKRTKCTPEEITQGSDLLKTILKKWRSEANLDEITCDEATDKLKKLFEEEYKEQISSSTFLQEVLTM